MSADLGPYKVARYGDSYAVFKGAERVSAQLGKLQAEGQALRLARAAKRTKRPCITCGTTFESEGKHNRMCKFCRGHASALGNDILMFANVRDALPRGSRRG